MFITNAISPLEREDEIVRLDGQLPELAEPLDQRLLVLPSWIRQQITDFVGLLNESPTRAKAEFQRLNLAVTLHVVRENGRQFYRADARADLPWLTGTADFAGSAARLSDR